MEFTALKYINPLHIKSCNVWYPPKKFL